MARIARTGEFTPPGRTRTARAYASAARASVSEAGTGSGPVLAFPVLVVVREVQEADLLKLGARVQRRALGDAGVVGDRVEDRVALLLGAPVGHREDAVGPVL